MKRLKGMLCIIFLYMMAGTLTVHAGDRSFEAGAGITFESGAETQETQEQQKSPGTTGTTSSGKASLPQTGQNAGTLLPTVGGIILVLACGWTVVKGREKQLHSLKRKRAGLL